MVLGAWRTQGPLPSLLTRAVPLSISFTALWPVLMAGALQMSIAGALQTPVEWTMDGDCSKNRAAEEG